MIPFTAADALLTVVDMQLKLLPAMQDPDPVADRTALLLRGAQALQLDVAVTEQYPKGLGSTVPALAELLPAGTPVIAKTSFSVFDTPEYCTVLAQKKRSTLILCGIEAHVCVLQSIFDARARGLQVILAEDASGSRKDSDKLAALAAARQAGAWVLSAEAILFLLLKNAAHPAFKTISKLVR